MSEFMVVGNVVRESEQKITSNVLKSPRDAANWLKENWSTIGARTDRECLVVVGVGSRNRVIMAEVVSIGTLTSSVAHPREIFRSLIISGAARFFLAHNHPSGDVDPSDDDRNVTTRMITSGTTLGIPLLDHLIIGDEFFYSITEEYRFSFDK